jgi:hypothetical protein
MMRLEKEMEMSIVSRAKVYMEGGHILNPDDIVAVKMVTVIGWGGDFAVYQGPTDWTDQEVSERGDKVSAETGRAVAPYCAHLSYRN